MFLIALFYLLLTSPQACERHIVKAEIQFKIPRHLLRAIARVESGHKPTKAHRWVAWPWSANIDGRGYYFKTKEEAIRTVKKFYKKGGRNIDVGCLQINLRSHPKAFRDLEEAFDPKKNVYYGARFLKREKKHHGSWTEAVGAFHSHTPKLSRAYKKRVLKEFRRIKESRTSPE